MPPWTPEEKWKDEDVFIIGGGDSLRSFDWNLLKDEMTIGCNSAFLHGSEICKICLFGDAEWFSIYKHDLERYEGIVFTNSPQLFKTRISWVWTMQREQGGLFYKSLGWNGTTGNTGASAVNLALILGAKRVFLLGFDMQLSSEGKPNWHDRLIKKPKAAIYPKFVRQFLLVKKDLKNKFPGREIINITDDSNLNLFSKIGVQEFWKERKSA